MFKDNRSLSVGNPEIDGEHQALDDLIAKFERMVFSKSSVAELNKVFEDIMQSAQSHFKNEEKFFNSNITSYEKLHKLEHDGFVKDLNKLQSRLGDPNNVWQKDFLKIANELTRHIIKFDMELSKTSYTNLHKE